MPNCRSFPIRLGNCVLKTGRTLGDAQTWQPDMVLLQAEEDLACLKGTPKPRACAQTSTNSHTPSKPTMGPPGWMVPRKETRIRYNCMVSENRPFTFSPSN